MNAVAFLHRVDGDDVRMVELRKCLCLATKSPEPLRVLGNLGGQHLEGYVAAEFRIGSAIYLTHAASAERRLDFICSES